MILRFVTAFCLIFALSEFSPYLSAINSDRPPITLKHGVVVELVSKHSEAEKAGIRPGDVLLRWSRGYAKGEIESPFDLPYIRFEQGSRGPVSLIGLRGGDEKTWMLGSDVWGISARPDLPDPLLQMYLKGEELVAVGDAIEAAKYWRAAVAEALKYDKPWLGSWFLSRTGWVLYDAKQWNEYDAAYRAAIQESAGAGPVARAEIFRQWAERMEFQDDLARAERYYSAALLEWESLSHNSMTVANTLLHLGVVDLKRGEFNDAEEHLNRALGLAEEMAPASIQTSLILSNLGVLFEDRGDLAKAEEYYMKGLAKEEKYFPNTLDLAHVLTAIGTLAHKRGDLVRAEAYHRRALAIAGKFDTSSFYVVDILRNLGECLLDRGDVSGAEKYQRQALGMAEKISPESLSITYILGSLGRIARVRRDLLAAEQYYRQALELAKKKEAAPEEIGELLAGAGDVSLDLGSYKSAEELYRQALAIFERVNPGSINHAETLANLASAMHNQGKVEPATELFRAALSGLETRAFQLGAVDEDRSRYRAWYAGYYQEYMELLLAQGHTVEAFELLESSRARTLLEMLSQAHIRIEQGADSEALQEERKLEELLHAKSEFRVRLAGGSQTNAQLLKIDAEIGDLRLRQEQIRAQLRANSPGYAALVHPQPLNLKDIQQLLDNDTLLLEYALGENHSYVWAVTRDSLSVHELPNQAEIEKLARDIYEFLVTPVHQIQSETVTQTNYRRTKAESQLVKKSAELSQIIFGPVADVLQNRRLLIVPDGALRYIPFAALPVPSAPTASNATRQIRYLILDHEIVNLPSASILRELRRQRMGRQQPPFDVAVFADPVFESSDERIARNVQLVSPGQKQAVRNLALKPKRPSDDRLTRAISDFEINRGNGFHLRRLLYTRREAAAIMSVIPNGRAMEALDFQANRKSAMSSMMSRYRAIHFATHGLLNNDHPELSGLVLSLVDEMGHPQDGFLNLEDIYNMHLAADLVVLSACDTALGQEVKGEGLIGLTRGFMYAGAMRVVASLWSVDDVATSELMARFYKAMERDKLPPAAALRMAQIQMLRQQKWKSPFYWSAFQIHGEWR